MMRVWTGTGRRKPVSCAATVGAILGLCPFAEDVRDPGAMFALDALLPYEVGQRAARLRQRAGRFSSTLCEYEASGTSLDVPLYLSTFSFGFAGCPRN